VLIIITIDDWVSNECLRNFRFKRPGDNVVEMISRLIMVKSTTIQSISYTLDELRPIRSSIDQCRSYLIQFIEQYKSMNLLELETRLLSRCVYKNWNARRAELGIQASRRTVRLLERLLIKREQYLERILIEFKPDNVEIRLPSRGTFNQLLLRLDESILLLSKIKQLSKTTIDRLRLECSRANYVHYNILIMSLCSRIYFLVLALQKSKKEFSTNVKKLIKIFKKKTKE
jgi:hypothetical protein